MRISCCICLFALLLAGCVSQPQQGVDYFSGQAGFAAARELETRVYEDVAYPVMLTHVIDVLLDMDCALMEANKELGVISAASTRNLYEPGSLLFFGQHGSCPPHGGTVTVTQLDDFTVEVRAAFLPVQVQTQETFTTLLMRSIELKAGE
ncbi:hypothetical protein EYC98_08210 [Halieaceae bacterium IMCC14734]|uniref:Uncharacterized protein n=1 Tax=Candidatus Litorirhabdus singularis TaxID=2518993 RepID=A0ABT3TEX7_9GAMM|nr:hypothetical protein [Candidatus Litorirhabdus singularis]MCX2980856.1 hypothetical protein [Candidatus Litorirhabdus singularis]